MENTSFHQRFKNRSQFIPRGGELLVGPNSISKKQLSRRKIHFNTIINPTSNNPLGISKVDSTEDLSFNINKSFSYVKLPPLQYSKKMTLKNKVRILADGSPNKAASPPIQNQKLNVLRDFYYKAPNKNNGFTRNASLALLNC